MNTATLNKELDNALIGTSWDAWSTTTDTTINKVLSKYAPMRSYDYHTNKCTRGLTTEQKGQVFRVIYSGDHVNQTIYIIRISKAKGARTQYGYDWTIKDVEVESLTNYATLELAITAAEAEDNKQSAYKQDVKDAAVKLATKLQSLGLSRADARAVISELSNHWASITSDMKWD